MRPSRFTEEQIIGMLKEHEAGTATADVCRKHGISSATFYKFKAKYGGMDVSDARRLKTLEDENARLKKLLAERSPLSRVDAINKPLLIGHGANDPRVKQDESDQIVKAMMRRTSPSPTCCSPTRATASPGRRTPRPSMPWPRVSCRSAWAAAPSR